MTKAATLLTVAVALAACGIPAAPPAAADASGPYVFVNAFDHMCLEVAGASTAQGAAIVQNDCTGSDSQRWQTIFIERGDDYNATTDYYELKNVHSQMCLDVPYGNLNPGTLLQQWPCWGGQMQLWATETVSTVYPVAVHVKSRLPFTDPNDTSNHYLCLDDKDWSTTLGSRLQTWPCWVADVQLWRQY